MKGLRYSGIRCNSLAKQVLGARERASLEQQRHDRVCHQDQPHAGRQGREPDQSQADRQVSANLLAIATRGKHNAEVLARHPLRFVRSSSSGRSG